MTHPLAVQFKRRPGFARQVKFGRLDELCDARRRLSAREQTRRAAHQRPPIQARQDADVQKPVAQIGLRKGGNRPAVKTSVADQHKFAGDALAAGAHGDFRLPLAQGLQPGDDVGQRPDFFLCCQSTSSIARASSPRRRAGQSKRCWRFCRWPKIPRAAGQCAFPSALQNFPGAFDAQAEF
jgi:hypothetical protein